MDDEVGNALYFMLSSVAGLDVVVDGWSPFRITAETATTLDAVGLMMLLPGGSAPLSFHVDAIERGLDWRAQASLSDESWLSLSQSKRWNAVYLYSSATVELASQPLPCDASKLSSRS